MQNKRHADLTTALFVAIITKMVQPGERFPSAHVLAQQFAVSRAVVREAMHGLELRGMVEVRHGSGSFVLPHSSWDRFDALVVEPLVSSAMALARSVGTRGSLGQVLDAVDRLDLPRRTADEI